MYEIWKGQPIQCETFHPQSWDFVVDDSMDNPTYAFAFSATYKGNKLLDTKMQTFEGNELLRSVLKLWRNLDVCEQIKKNGKFLPHLYQEDFDKIQRWLILYGSPYIQISPDDTGELHVLDDEHLYFSVEKFIMDLYNIVLTYQRIQEHESSYSHWPIFLHTDGYKLVLRAANLTSIAYVQMIFAALPGNDKMKLCEHCGGLFVAQRRNARLCEDCFLHRSTAWYQKNKGGEEK